MDYKNVNILVLAYLGDTVYEYYIRKYLIERNISNVNDLQTESVKYVSAVNQARFLKYLLDNNMLNEEELDVVHRARNHKGCRHPKNCDIVTYKYATALEALIGYLKMIDNNKRIEEIMNGITGGIIC